MNIKLKYYLFVILFFIVGSTIANVINRLIYRYYNDIPFFGIKSFCPNCQEFYKWYDDLPVIGYILQLGRCRNCHKRLDLYRFIIELLTGTLFSCLFIKYDISYDLLFYYLLIIIILVISSIFKRINKINDFSLLFFSIFVTLYSLFLIINENELFNIHFLGFIISFMVSIVLKFILKKLYIQNEFNLNQCIFISFFGFLIGYKILFISIIISLIFTIFIIIFKYNGKEKIYNIQFTLYIIFGMTICLLFS